jgi:hypothetical protein
MIFKWKKYLIAADGILSLILKKDKDAVKEENDYLRKISALFLIVLLASLILNIYLLLAR